MAGEVRDILVAVAGLTPQVITETLYYLTQVRRPPVVPAAVYVLTTRRGQACLLTHLLAPEEGRFFAFCREYGLEAAAIAVELQVLSDARGQPLDDIRTPEDSAAVADQIAALVARLAADPATRLHCSIAGGRKTQAVLLGFALQLYGRPQDTLLHVLVSEAAEAPPRLLLSAAHAAAAARPRRQDLRRQPGARRRRRDSLCAPAPGAGR
ncbi:MAG: hypothetical protein KatS3mg131_2248 [Candidatus Tectimicrobiota bacterium]|nr:MAG: hypothetical protein KatS3mg131_2248 [Candidatus Tectomicrobia bacterium]